MEEKVLVDYLQRMRAEIKAEKRKPTEHERRLIDAACDSLDQLTIDNHPMRDVFKPDPGDKINFSRRSEGPFKTAGEQLMAIREAATPGGKLDERLYQVRAATGLSEAVGSDGGFLLQEDFSAQILSDAIETGKLAGLCKRITVSSNANLVKVPGIDETSRASTRWGGSVGYWTAEAAEKTASRPKIRQVELNLNKLVVLTYSTDELIQDSALAERVIRESAAHELGFQIDEALVNGSGVGRPLGILNAGCLVSQTAEGGQAANSVLTQNLVKMYSRCINVENAVWLVNQDVLPELFTISLAVGTGGAPMFLTNAQDQPGLRLLGLPIVLTEQCATVGTVGDIILANFKDGYLLAEKGGVQADMSIHVRSRWAARSGDVTVNSSLKRGNLSVVDIRQSRASRDSDKAEQGQGSWASVETLHELPLAA